VPTFPQQLALPKPQMMDPVYLDYAATTPVRAEVREAMLPLLTETFGNPSSPHRWGRKAAEALSDARATAAQALGATPAEIFFTRGGTESDNLAVLGTTRALADEGQIPTLVVTSVEHHAVHDAAEKAESAGQLRRVVLDVSPEGTVDMDRLDEVLAEGHCVVSAMWVNNETGIVLPIPEMVDRVSAAGGTMHSDAVQAFGKLPVSVDAVPIDLLSVTGHKIYGPKGTGLLFVRAGTKISPLLFGGGQERALRPGTEDVAGAVGLATAMRLGVDEQGDLSARLHTLQSHLETRITKLVPNVRINGGMAQRGPHVSSFGVPGVDGQQLLMALDLEGIAVSGGSACASGSTGGSHVIAALYGDDDPTATVRFSLGRHSTKEELDRAATTFATVVERLRGLRAPG
jgi:cysteine desulfurase